MIVPRNSDRERFPRKTVPLDAEALGFRQELGLGAGDFLVVTVGMIHPRKGLVELVEAFADVLRTRPNAHLAIVGATIFNKDDGYEECVRGRVHALGVEERVYFTGARGDVPAVLRAADLFVLNAKIEPFGLVILEAMSSGTPVIATEVGGIPEIIEDGVSGELVFAPGQYRHCKDVEILPARIDHAIAMPLLKLAEAAYTQVLPRFSMESFTANLQRVYGDILSPHV